MEKEINKIGHCKGIRTFLSRNSLETKEVDIELTITHPSWTTQKFVEIVKGGVTGFEGFALPTNNKVLSLDWTACMGTEGRWDRLEIKTNELKKALTELGY